MKKQLTDILENVPVISHQGSLEIEIDGISSDSRTVSDSFVFVALKGLNNDGHLHIEKAIQNGAYVIVYQDKNFEIKSPGHVTMVLVKDSSYALGVIASNYYDNPSSELKLIGVIGTNGKTTTATLLYEMFLNFGVETGLISTIKNFINGKEIETKYTTPDPIEFNRLLDQMVIQGCIYCFAEISSHAIDQNRIAGLEFAGGIFTNITHDHLDYHKDFKEYLDVKKRFFDNLPKEAFAISNIDDKNGRYILQNTKAKQFTYAIDRFSDFKTTIIEKHFDGTLLEINDRQIWTLLIGKFNAYNITAVYACAVLLGVYKDDVLQLLSLSTSVKGRFQIVRGKSKNAIIDYAHTPDAIDNVLQTIEDIKNENQKIITVCGAGGNRDKTKRPIMAQVAVKYSDKVILTSDNPRNENPEDILNDMLAGLSNSDLEKVVKIVDRKEAIKIAVMFANEDDIILIAGKGHENYQEINGIRTEFDDKKIVEQFLN